ncbi:MAG: serine hydrolase [Acidobacteriota bacterium]|nr:serine hydrolase [Acidobacteriota bacterium]MDH3529054.1 serine hydrolase [Acidobacteriota bacterium]
MRLKRSLFLLLITLATASSAIAQDHAKTIDELVRKYQEYGQFNGAVLVAEKGKVILKKGYGKANMEWDIPIATDTKFRIGSVTKQFTAAMIMQLVDEGKVKLDAKMTEYLPDYRKDTGDKVTIHHLLNHTSGIPSYTNGEFFREFSRDPYTVDEFVKKFTMGDLEFEPGSKWNYNNSGYFLLGAIIEKVTGKSYAENLSERITGPVGMTNTGYDTHDPLIKNRAQGYQKTPNGFTNAPYLDMSLPYAAGSMYSTVEDLYKWDQALYGDKLMSAASKQKMFTPGLQEYGYGLRIVDRKIGNTDRTAKEISHGGGINGFNSLFTRLVDGKHLIVILDNVGQGRYHDAITSGVVSILNGLSYENPKMSIAEALNVTANNRGGAAAVAKYREFKKKNPDKYDFREGELNTLGYQLIRSGKTKDAIEVFKLNVEMYPEASNPYDSLGEAYLKDGDKINAVANYKKSLELNPANLGAKAAIDKIEGREVKVDSSVLEKYSGVYEAGPIGKITVRVADGQLMAKPESQPEQVLSPQSENVFFIAAVGARITFDVGDDAKVTGMTINQGGQELKAPKIN